MTAAAAGRAGRGAGAGELLRVEDLRTWFRTDAGVVRAVDGVSFEVRRGETLALVGESGCGKSVTALSILGLLPTPPAEIVSGHVWLDAEDLLAAGDERLRAVRGNDIAMIFQEPMTSLNPVYTIGDQIVEAIVLHEGAGPSLSRRRAVRMLQRVGIPSPERRVDDYPHQLSGGMRQRAMIAMALSCNPQLLIADEPTTALDVTIQAQILELLRGLQDELHMSILLITHDLGVVAETAHRVVVMYAGRVAEQAEVADLFEQPRHPYTAGLFRSVPRLDARGGELEPIEGMVPDLLSVPRGCAFHPRCPYAMPRCREETPPLEETGASAGGHRHLAACWYTRERPGADLLAEHRAPPGEAGAGESPTSSVEERE